uniref:Peptidase S9 prolyl oligopeptidase catalytic domain-containing protein n=1 Tax=viral metagenome TaxID=1070528 RepID=A0A6C0D5T5_9ZZZZ
MGFLCWKQESSWMESMKGKRYNAMVKRENKLFKESVNKVSTFQGLIQKANEFQQVNGTIIFSYENIIFKVVGSEYEYTFNSKTYNVTDFDIYKNYIYHIRDIGEGSHKYVLECIYDGKMLWNYKNVGSQLYIHDNICYVLGVENKLWYNSVIALDYKTGKLLKLLYKEENVKYNLRFIKGEEQCLFLIREKSGSANLFVIEALSIKLFDNEATMFYPIGYYKNNLCYFENVNNIWKAIGFDCKSFTNNIEYASLKDNILVLRSNGKKIVYDLQFNKIYSFYGDIYFNPFTYKIKYEKCFIDFSDGGIVEISNFKSICYTRYCKLTEETCVSNDKTRVQYLVAEPYCKVQGLIVIGYGAYGNPSNVSSRRWKPFLDDGWILCFTFIRGSGDKDADWALEARTVNKIKSCEDFESCIKDVQKKYDITAHKTCIYGRSAGGYLVGMAASRNSSGKLFKMVYAEVPYVDVLRTTSNPKLPLTALEYDEFGDPSRSIYEFEKILEYSPVDSLDFTKPPDLYVLLRTSENDSQVYTYESYKWLEALRGVFKNDTRKILFNSDKSGHFINGDESFSNFSEDFFLLKHFRDNASKQ